MTQHDREKALTEENKRLRAFIETITDAIGPYPDLDGHRIVRDARQALALAADGGE